MHPVRTHQPSDKPARRCDLSIPISRASLPLNNAQRTTHNAQRTTHKYTPHPPKQMRARHTSSTQARPLKFQRESARTIGPPAAMPTRRGPHPPSARHIQPRETPSAPLELHRAVSRNRFQQRLGAWLGPEPGPGYRQRLPPARRSARTRAWVGGGRAEVLTIVERAPICGQVLSSGLVEWWRRSRLGVTRASGQWSDRSTALRYPHSDRADPLDIAHERDLARDAGSQKFKIDTAAWLFERRIRNSNRPESGKMLAPGSQRQACRRDRDITHEEGRCQLHEWTASWRLGRSDPGRRCAHQAIAR
ncbi:hypothetical protein AcV7_002883 [Taiwanofungus camphoratus]|nr:hypothetical protein AcV7_002883 [Antrodia cinnamomea]